MSTTSICAAPFGADPVRDPIRLTERGRAAALALLTSAVVAAVVVLLLGSVSLAGSRATVGEASATGSDAAALGADGPLRVHVVQRGDTLWDLAAALQPGSDPRPVVDRIRQVNGLSGSELSVGQRVLLPSAG